MSTTRERLLDAALDEFSEKGFDGATTRAIADRAGFREVTLFRHFGSKEKLLEAVLNERSVRPSTTQLFAGASERTPKELLSQVAEGFYGKMLERERIVRLLVMESASRPELRDRVSAVPRAIQEQLSAYLQLLMEQGTVRKGDPDLFALAFLSLFFSLVLGRSFLDTDPWSTSDIAREFTEIFLDGISL